MQPDHRATSKRPTIVALTLISALAANVASSQQSDDDDMNVLEIVVTGTKVTAGGAQDIAFARSEVSDGRIPHPTSFTDEGLLSQHDLTLTGSDDCDQLFCLISEVVESGSVSKPDDDYLVGLGFATNIVAESLTRRPQNIVAVVDKSGSMGGEPLALVRTALKAMVDELGAEDQLSIVLYGDRSHVYLPPTRLSPDNRDSVRDEIDAIESRGSTNMEEGLAVGYALARETAATFDGADRVILFTDERPNVGNSEADGFIAMATAASAEDIGLTTIGVGVQFDAQLAVRLSSARGGNLFFLDDADAALTLFARELDYMLSELAHDLAFTVTPAADFDVTGVYGVPDELLSWSGERAVTFSIPTVFLSSRGGGIFVTVARRTERANLPQRPAAGQIPIGAASIAYTPASATGDTARQSSEVALAFDARREPGRSIRLADLLLDEYMALRNATSAHYLRNDQKEAYRAVDALQQRFAAVSDDAILEALSSELELVSGLHAQFAFLAGYGGEAKLPAAMRLRGQWQVESLRVSGEVWELPEKGDRIYFGQNDEAWFRPAAAQTDEWEYLSTYDVGDEELSLDDFVLTFTYRLRKSTLRLTHRERETGSAIKLRLSLLTREAPADHLYD